MMAVEARRGCGYRKIGGLYLVSGTGGRPCDRLPWPLDVCPTCHQGFKQARGWTWIDLKTLAGGMHSGCVDSSQLACPVCAPSTERAGLLWIGEKFYPSTRAFNLEADTLGISRRIRVIPRGFELGKTWVLLAHPKAMKLQEQAGIFKVWKPTHIEKILAESQRDSEEAKELAERGITCVFVPDNDPDHRGSVYEDETEDQLELVQ